MNGFTSGRLGKGKHYWCPGNSGEQLSAGLDGKFPSGQAPWQLGSTHMRTHPVGWLACSRAGDTSQRPLRVVPHTNSHNGMFALSSSTDMLNVSERSDGLSVLAGMLLLKDLYSSPKHYWPFPACSLPSTPAVERGGGRSALLPAYRDTRHWKGCKTICSFLGGPFTVPFLSTRNAPGT